MTINQLSLSMLALSLALLAGCTDGSTGINPDGTPCEGAQCLDGTDEFQSATLAMEAPYGFGEIGMFIVDYDVIDQNVPFSNYVVERTRTYDVKLEHPLRADNLHEFVCTKQEITVTDADNGLDIPINWDSEDSPPCAARPYGEYGNKSVWFHETETDFYIQIGGYLSVPIEGNDFFGEEEDKLSEGHVEWDGEYISRIYLHAISATSEFEGILERDELP